MLSHYTTPPNYLASNGGKFIMVFCFRQEVGKNSLKKVGRFSARLFCLVAFEDPGIYRAIPLDELFSFEPQRNFFFAVLG